MLDQVFVSIGLIILAVAVVMAVLHRHNAAQCISNIMLGILASTFFMVLPTNWGEGGTMHKVVSALLYSFKAIGGRQDLKQLASISLSDGWRAVYLAVNYVSFALAPILTSSLIISGFGDMGERMRYFFRFGRSCHVFSQLNENALSLAKGIQQKKGLKTIVFCSTKNADKNLVEKAKKMGGILFHKKCEDFHLNLKHLQFEYYLISEDEDANIKAAIAVIENHPRVRGGRLTVNAFAQSGANINVVESLERGNIKLRFIDEIALFCNHLLYEHPLYDLPDGRKDISVMLIGCGRCGLQMLKTVAWCGQIEGYSLKIRAYDKKAQKIQKEFYALCPELQSTEYDIEFIQTDVADEDFEQKISGSLDATYVVIATGDDQLNITVADQLRGIFRRNNQAYDNFPPIFARVRSGLKADNLNRNHYLDARRIILFGNTEGIFAENTLFNTKLERLALAVHLSYCGGLGLKKGSKEYKDCVRSFETQEYNRRGSMAVALHLPAKLVSCGAMGSTEHDLTPAEARAFKEKKDEALLMLAHNEQHRWNAFMRSEGYRSADIPTMSSYAKILGDHRDKISKVHSGITDWDSLQELSAAYNQLRADEPNFSPEDFKKSNLDIIADIPAIIDFANEE